MKTLATTTKALPSFFGRSADQTTNLTSAASASSVATTNDHKEINVTIQANITRPQITGLRVLVGLIVLCVGLLAGSSVASASTVVYSNFTPSTGSGYDGTNYYTVKNSGFNGTYFTDTSIAVTFTVPGGPDYKLDKIEVVGAQTTGYGSYLHAHIETSLSLRTIDYNSTSQLPASSNLVIFNASTYPTKILKACHTYYLIIEVDTAPPNLSVANWYKNSAGGNGTVLYNDPSSGSTTYQVLGTNLQYPVFRISGTPQPTSCCNPSLIQSTYGQRGSNFEVVVPYPSGGIAHYWRDNDHDGAWYGPTVFGPAGQVDAVSMIESSWGNLEVVARQGNALSHYFRDSSGWHGTGVVANGASGIPSLVQNSNGNLELVTPLASGGVAHYYRDSSWHQTVVFGAGTTVDAVSLIQSSYGGNLEVVARIGSQLAHFYRDYTGSWYGTTVFASGVSGAPSLIEGPFGSPGNFEVVTPLAAGGMAHYWRDNSSPSQPWYLSASFGNGNVAGASLIHSNYGNNFEVVDRVGCSTLQHYYRDYLGQWDGPTTIVP